MPKQA